MSGFVAIWNLDRRPADPRLVQRMTETIAHRGPDGSGYWTDRSVALAHRMLHTTPESLHETQPLADETNTLCLALDGRVDNREELKDSLTAKGMALRTDTDAELILRAYECWGRDCPSHLLGDFAFVIWDGRNQRFFCARDPLGSKPFYYYMDNHVFLCASELPPIFAHPAVRRDLNEGMLGEYLASQITSQEETLYKGIYRLPPAHSLLVQPDRLWKERYWDIDPTKIISYKTDQEYTDHFLDLFKESVCCRLRSHGPVGSYLSGGLDSSSIVGMAQSLYREGLATDRGFETFSLIFPGWTCDESSYIQDVERMWGITSNRVRPEVQGSAYFATRAEQAQDFPGYPNGTMGNPLRALAREKGIRVLLSGNGGDEWLTGSQYHAADLVRGFRFHLLFRRALCESDSSGIGSALRSVLRYGCWPLLPLPMRNFLRRVLKPHDVPPWLNPRFARRIGLVERLHKEIERQHFISFAQADLHGPLTSGWWVHSQEIEERASSQFAVEERHPLNDRRIIEFALALPEEQRCRGDQRKFILRQSMRDLLPETVRARPSKVEFSPVFAQAFKALGGLRFFDSLAAISKEWIEPEMVHRLYRQMEQAHEAGPSSSIPHVWPLWMIIGIELWLRTVLLKQGDRTAEERLRVTEAIPQYV